MGDFKTQRERDGYVITDSEGSKLARLFEKYGIVNFVNSVNSAEGMESPEEPLEPRLI